MILSVYVAIANLAMEERINAGATVAKTLALDGHSPYR